MNSIEAKQIIADTAKKAQGWFGNTKEDIMDSLADLAGWLPMKEFFEFDHAEKDFQLCMLQLIEYKHSSANELKNLEQALYSVFPKHHGLIYFWTESDFGFDSDFKQAFDEVN